MTKIGEKLLDKRLLETVIWYIRSNVNQDADLNTCLPVLVALMHILNGSNSKLCQELKVFVSFSHLGLLL